MTRRAFQLTRPAVRVSKNFRTQGDDGDSYWCARSVRGVERTTSHMFLADVKLITANFRSLHARWKAACGSNEKKELLSQSTERSRMYSWTKGLKNFSRIVVTRRVRRTRWLSVCPWRSSGKAAKLGKDGTLQELSWPARIQRKQAQIWDIMASNHCECNGTMRKDTESNNDFLRRVIGHDTERSTL